MDNTFKEHLINYFNKSSYHFHISYRLENLLNNEYDNINHPNSQFFSMNRLYISDWTNESEEGWELPFSSNVFTKTDKENYVIEMNNLKSRQNLLNYSQTFEAFQGFLKDCITQNNNQIKRENLYKNNIILLNLKNEIGETFKNKSNRNNKNYKFEPLFDILVQLRHSITHSNGLVEKNKIIKDEYSNKLFRHMMPEAKFEKSNIILEMPFSSFKRNMTILNEFAFQIYKIFSIENDFDYKL